MTAPKGIPIPRTGNMELDRFLSLAVQRLNSLDSEITRVSSVNSVGGRGTGTGGTRPVIPGENPVPELDTPPKPLNLSVFCGIGLCILEWANPFKYYSNHARTRVFRNTSDDFDTAAEIGQADWILYVDETVQDETGYWWWVRFESTSGVTGPVSDSVNGTSATDPEVFYTNLLATLKADPSVADILSDPEEPTVINEEIIRIASILSVLAAGVDRVGRATTNQAVTRLATRVTTNEEGIVSNSRSITNLAAVSNVIRLGPAQNRFVADSLANAERLRDSYGVDNASWLTEYNGNGNLYIILEY